jgi:hypothetical protein
MSGFELERVMNLMDGPADPINKELLAHIKRNRTEILAKLKQDGVAEVRVPSGQTFKIRAAA